MEKSKMNLRIFSTLFIALGICDIVSFLITYLSGSLKQDKLASIGNVDVEKIVIIALIVCVVITFLVKLFLGIKGIRQSLGKSKGKSNIVIATIIFVLLIIFTVMAVVALIQKNGSVFDLLTYIANLIIVFYYIKSAKEVVED